MTLYRLKQKYIQMHKDSCELVTVTQVLNDLQQVKSIGKPPKKEINNGSKD